MKRIQNLCTYPTGIEYAGTVEAIEIEIETKVTQRQEPHQNRREREGDRRQVLPRGTSHPEKIEVRAPNGHPPPPHTHTHIYIFIYSSKMVRAPCLVDGCSCWPCLFLFFCDSRIVTRLLLAIGKTCTG